MKFRIASFPLAVASITVSLLMASSLPASAQSVKDSSGFVGRWQINLPKTTLNRNGPSAKYTPRGATYTQIISAQGENLKLDAYNQYPQATPNRSIPIIADEKEHPCTGTCTGGDGTTVETYAYHQIDPHLMVRLTYLNGKISEYISYGLSTDGKTMTQITWSPQTPEWQSNYVYDKQQ